MLNTEKLKQLKELLDMGAISQEEFDIQKDALIQEEKPKKNAGLISAIIVVVIICLSIMFDGNSGNEKSAELPRTDVETSILEKFAEPCPVKISSSMYDNIIGMPEIKCILKNNTDKEITAIKFHFSPKDVYGEEVNSIFTTNWLYTDNPIAAGESSSSNWQLMESSIKSGDIYVYSVYFSDNTEWGDRNASVSDIKKYAYKIYTKY